MKLADILNEEDSVDEDEDEDLDDNSQENQDSN
jgi:hypothetical protein